MTETDDRITESIARKRREKAERAASLGRIGFSEPQRLGGDSGFGAIFGGPPTEAVSCLSCGAMVLLNQPVEGADGTMIEGDIKAHVEFHIEVGVAMKPQTTRLTVIGGEED